MILLLIIFMQSVLTPRWFDINPKAINLPIQQKLKSDLANKTYRQYIVAAGRRSYKTERFIKRFVVGEAMNNLNHVYYVGAPTRTQAKNILWDDLKKLSPRWCLKSTPFVETDLKINFKTGSSIRVVGLESFKRIQGGLCHGFAFTEYQDCLPESYNESVQPMLNDTGGWCVKEGRPFGKNHFYDDFQKGVKLENGICSYHWKSREILTEEQIKNAMEDIAEKDYLREYDASFETEYGNPYYAYSENNHRKFEYRNTLPLIVTCDFNATDKPMSWVIGQRLNQNNIDNTFWIKSLQYAFTNTPAMCVILDEHIKTLSNGYPSQILFYGDFSAKKETSNSVYSDWEHIKRYFNNKSKIELRLKYCKSIRNSIAATNGQMKNTLGMIRQYVDPDNCKGLIRDYEYCQWSDNQRELLEQSSKPFLGHLCRAVDYYNDYEHPYREDTKISITNAA